MGGLKRLRNRVHRTLTFTLQKRKNHFKQIIIIIIFLKFFTNSLNKMKLSQDQLVILVIIRLATRKPPHIKYVITNFFHLKNKTYALINAFENIKRYINLN
jgi:hypothetical protein